MVSHAMPPLADDERVLFAQRGYLPFPGTSLAACGALLLLTDLRLLFAPRRLMRIPAVGEAWVRSKSTSLRDITEVAPLSSAALCIRTRFRETVSFHVLPTASVGFVWPARNAGPDRDEVVRRIMAACGHHRGLA